jgi:hypothetical protein
MHYLRLFCPSIPNPAQNDPMRSTPLAAAMTFLLISQRTCWIGKPPYSTRRAVRTGCKLEIRWLWINRQYILCLKLWEGGAYSHMPVHNTPTDTIKRLMSMEEHTATCLYIAHPRILSRGLFIRTGKSRIRFLMRSINFCTLPKVSSRIMTLVSTQPLIEMKAWQPHRRL